MKATHAVSGMRRQILHMENQWRTIPPTGLKLLSVPKDRQQEIWISLLSTTVKTVNNIFSGAGGLKLFALLINMCLLSWRKHWRKKKIGFSSFQYYEGQITHYANHVIVPHVLSFSLLTSKCEEGYNWYRYKEMGALTLPPCYLLR